MSKLSLLQQALQQTETNVVKVRSSKKSNNDRLLEMLLDKEPMTKLEIVAKISLDRMNEIEEVTEKSFKDEKFLEDFKKMNKTVNNGFDTSVSNSNNNSSFSYNEKYNEYTLSKTEDRKWTITRN